MNDDKEENRIVNGSRIMRLQSTKQSLHFLEEREKEEERTKGSRKRGEGKILFDPEKSILKF